MKTHLLFVLAATLCCDLAWANEVTDYLIGARGGNKLPYRLSIPDDYSKNTKDYPLLIYLHGISSRGSNLKIGAGPSGKHWTEKFIIVAPQCPAGQTWWQAPPMDNMRKIVEYEKTQLRVDDDRVCVTGYSMGGFGTYNLVHTYPKLRAAAASIFGTGTWIKASALKHIPFWGFHGARDNRVQLSGHQKTVDKLRAADAYVRFTVFPKMGHGPFGPSFNPTLCAWMLAEKRGTPHNYELSVNDGTRTKLLGFLEPKTVHTITARAPDQAKGEVFAGWTSAGGSAYKHPTHASNTTTHPVKSKGRFGNARALTTTFTMPANDVIITATYKIDSHKETCRDHNEENSNESTAS
ncbi:MAG: dienelactone hydrolase family protein [Planctomycetes bacterium]|nr:dienelactone hydrolase family protein [Planctomycetota bacterium]